MGIEYTIIVKGTPTGKGRPRFGNGHTYTPKNTVDYERLVRDMWQLQTSGAKQFPGAVEVLITAFYKIPSSASKKARAAMAENVVLPMKKPDADNIAKIIMDALNGLAYEDDKQVVRLEVVKRYAAGEPCVSVTVKECD